MILLEELKTQNQTQILLLHQLLDTRSTGANSDDVAQDFGLPVSTKDQLLKLEDDCYDTDIKGRLVRSFLFVLINAYILFLNLAYVECLSS